MSDTITPVLIVEKWPDIPGHPGRTITTTAMRKSRTKDDRYWLVRPKGMFKRWRWLPKSGTFVSIRETS